MTKLTIHPILQNTERISIYEFLNSCATNRIRFYQNEQLYKKKLQKIHEKYAHTIKMELIQTGLPPNVSLIDMIFDTLASQAFIRSKPDLNQALADLQHNSLQKSRTSIRLYKKVPHLFFDTFLKSHFWKRVIDITKKDTNEIFPKLLTTNHYCKTSYIHMVRKNLQEFIQQYEHVIISYNHSIMQTQFKFQLIFGMDISREILSYV